MLITSLACDADALGSILVEVEGSVRIGTLLTKKTQTA